MENQDTRTFKIDPSIEMKPVRFKNRFGIELAGHLYLPENYETQKNAAIIVAGPFGAVKEQAAGLYAQQFASMGFVSLALIRPSAVRAAARFAIPPPRTSSPRITAPPWTASACWTMWTVIGLGR